ncbi:MAG: hypothetical protein WBQ17_12300 [Rhizomicrobium sp.]
MDAYSYLSVLLSIVLGLSITQLLGGFAGMVRGRARIAFYWPLPLQMLCLFLINVQSWWAMFGLRNMRDWTFGGFFIVLLQVTFTYLMSATITPDPVGEDSTMDQHEFFFREKNWFFIVSLCALLSSLTKDFFVIHATPGVLDVGAQGAFIVLILIGLFTRSDWVIKTIIPVTFVLYCAYIALLFVRMPG